MKKIKALSFFSGAMGLDIGLEKAGIDVILACESEKFIRDTIKLKQTKIKSFRRYK
jgi:DNA (cytosine-5)-methyltransferase 1